MLDTLVEQSVSARDLADVGQNRRASDHFTDALALRRPGLGQGDAARPYRTAAVDEARIRAADLAAARPTTVAA
ncbi:hypothetical protein ACF09G_31400 [Streptomyces albogriseolus]|uniref:hypothetical protein n=1 Tax=Streptomyces albogriseolus TaxID=1887 RepID=UPI00199D9945|nr:hypothetical protein [Streptomyces sp.]